MADHRPVIQLRHRGKDQSTMGLLGGLVLRPIAGVRAPSKRNEFATFSHPLNLVTTQSEGP